VIAVDTVVSHQHPSAGAGQPRNGQLHIRRRSSHVIVVIVPHQDRQMPFRSRRQRIHIRLTPHSGLQNIVDVPRSLTLHANAVAFQQPRHAKQVEHRLIDSIRRQRAEAIEIRLPFEFERPRQHAFDVHVRPLRQPHNVA